jgi:hypothetical protein
MKNLIVIILYRPELNKETVQEHRKINQRFVDFDYLMRFIQYAVNNKAGCLKSESALFLIMQQV